MSPVDAVSFQRATAIQIRSNADKPSDYPTWRGKAHTSARYELALFAMILDEAGRRDYCTGNVARGLRLKPVPTKEKRAWTNHELTKVDTELKRREPFGWMRCTFLLGRFQAARLRQCNVALTDIHLDANPPTIYYQAPKGGRERAYSQPIDRRLLDDLRAIYKHRLAAGATTLCEIPWDAIIDWRRFLDELGIKGVSHHSLRVTWITRAAMAGIPESVAQRFSNHSSNAVHRIYQRFSSADMAQMLERLA